VLSSFRDPFFGLLKPELSLAFACGCMHFASIRSMSLVFAFGPPRATHHPTNHPPTTRHPPPTHVNHPTACATHPIWAGSYKSTPSHSVEKDIAPNHGLSMDFPLSQIKFSYQIFQLVGSGENQI